jgi:glycosyltransferase involved in cell wall biosynthesis
VLELVPALRAQGVEVIEAANDRRRPPAGGGIGSVRNYLADRRWLARTLPQFAADIGAQIVHHPLPAHARQPPSRQVITVHDLAFETHPEHFDPRFARWASRAHRRAAEQADVVICVSETTAADVRERWGIDPERIVVAPHGPGQELPEVAPRAPEHVLYLGDDEPRKNLDLVRRATFPLPLRTIGGAGEGVDPPTLAQVFAGALALVHPSLHEGFGLAPLEAMVAGVPVVAVRCGAVEEVCGDAAVYVDERDPGEMSDAVQRIHEDPEWRSRLVALGRERAARFSWEASARAHIAAYERALRRG